MKIFTIATQTHETYGHGDSGKEWHIIKDGAYFPPCFLTREKADHYDKLTLGPRKTKVVQLFAVIDHET